MKKVIIFGDLPLSTEIAKYLDKLGYIELAGVVTLPRTKKIIDAFDSESLYDYAVKNNIQVYTVEELNKTFKPGDLDFGFTIRITTLLKKSTLSLFKQGVLNFHGGLLPEYGGLYSPCHEVLQQSKVAGGALHLIPDEKIDAGDIAKRCEFETVPTDTAETVFLKTQQALYDGFREIADDFLNGRLQLTPQSFYIEKGYKVQYFNKNSLEKELQLDDAVKDAIAAHARGYEFTNHERGYIIHEGQKIYFTTKNLEGLM